VTDQRSSDQDREFRCWLCMKPRHTVDMKVFLSCLNLILLKMRSMTRSCF